MDKNDIQIIEEKFEKVEEKFVQVGATITGFSGQLQNISGQLTNVLLLLRGNELDRNDEGYIGKVKSLEKEIEDNYKHFENAMSVERLRTAAIEKKIDRTVYWMLGAGFGLGVTAAKILASLIK